MQVVIEINIFVFLRIVFTTYTCMSDMIMKIAHPAEKLYIALVKFKILSLTRPTAVVGYVFYGVCVCYFTKCYYFDCIC